MSGAKWKGKNLTKAMGHQFEENLECKLCGVHWQRHQVDPQKCATWRPTPVRTPKGPRVPQPKLPHDLHEPESLTPPLSRSQPTPYSEPVHE